MHVLGPPVKWLGGGLRDGAALGQHGGPGGPGGPIQFLNSSAEPAMCEGRREARRGEIAEVFFGVQCGVVRLTSKHPPERPDMIQGGHPLPPLESDEFPADGDEFLWLFCTFPVGCRVP
jgi:hypothetical protein